MDCFVRSALRRDRHTPRKRSIQYAAASRFHHWHLGILDRPLSRAMTVEGVAHSYSSDTTSLPRGAVRPSCAFISRPNRGRGERRVPAAPAASCALCIGKKHTSKRVHRNHPAFPHAMVLTVSFVLSPVTGLFCHRRSADMFLSKPGRADLTPRT